MNKNFTMKVVLGLSALCSASLFVFLVCAKAAGGPVLPAAKPPVPAAELQEAATSYAETPYSEDDAVGHIEFDDFNNINDPLYREGSKVLLQKAVDDDKSPKVRAKSAPVKKSLWRDAPAAIPAKAAKPAPIKNVNEIKSPVFPAKKNRLIKLIPADPVENKSIL